MKITAHEITGWYHVALHCDKCDAIMNQSQYDYDSHEFKSVCPVCGNEMYTGSIMYPYTKYNWLIEPIEEEEV